MCNDPAFTFVPTEAEVEGFREWWSGHFGEELELELARERFASLVRFYYHSTGYGQDRVPPPADPAPPVAPPQHS